MSFDFKVIFKKPPVYKMSVILIFLPNLSVKYNKGVNICLCLITLNV